MEAPNGNDFSLLFSDEWEADFNAQIWGHRPAGSYQNEREKANGMCKICFDRKRFLAEAALDASLDENSSGIAA
jgi:hypothetical protein